MEIIWQLFGVHISLTIIILSLFISWLIWPRKYKNIRKYLLLSGMVVLLGSLILALFTYWPRSYPKQYLKNAIPVEKESISLKQLADSLDFHIGIATSPSSEYEELIAAEFNSIVAENHFKPGKLLVDATNWKFDFEKADLLMDYVSKNGFRMRGHTLVWGKFPGMTFPQPWVEMTNNSANPKETMKSLIKRYIETVMGRYKGKIQSWDVVNEPMSGEELYSSIFTQSMGEEYIDYAFKIARNVDPHSALFLNEQIEDYNGPQGIAFLALLKRLLDRGVPIDGVGLQCHHVNVIHDIAAMKKYIRTIGKLGLRVEITELDIRLLLFGDDDNPYEAQGDQYKKVVQACLADPICEGVTLWGLTDGVNWMDAVPPFKWKSPNAPNIWDENMLKKPGYWGIWHALAVGR